MADKDCKTCGPTKYVPEAKIASVEAAVAPTVEPTVAPTVEAVVETKDGSIVSIDWRQTAYNVQTKETVLNVENISGIVTIDEGIPE